MRAGDTALLALHYQNENCHVDGRIRIGMPADAPWREERLGNARRLLAGCRAVGMAVLHVRLAVRPDYADVVANTPIIRQWIELGAWREGSWGVQFLDGFEPREGEFVITHTRNSVFHGCATEDVLRALGARQLLVAGVSTAYVVEGSVRHATDIGYPCTVVGDACSTATPVQHEAALAALALLADVRGVDAVLADLAEGQP